MLDHALAGLAGSLASFMCVWPSEVIKYHLQQRHTSVLGVTREILNKNGIRGLYAGFAPACMSVVSKNTLSFTLYRKVSESVPVPFSGIITGAVSSVLTTPMMNMTLRQVNHPGVNPLRYFYGNPMRLYTGLSTNFIVDSIRVVVRFGVYDKIHTQLLQYKCGFLAGGIANVCVCFVNNPMDVAMTRMQSNYAENITLRNAIRSIYAERGIRGLYAGAGVRAVRSIPGGIVMFGAYEYALKYIRILKNEHIIN